MTSREEKSLCVSFGATRRGGMGSMRFGEYKPEKVALRIFSHFPTHLPTLSQRSGGDAGLKNVKEEAGAERE